VCRIFACGSCLESCSTENFFRSGQSRKERGRAEGKGKGVLLCQRFESTKDETWSWVTIVIVRVQIGVFSSTLDQCLWILLLLLLLFC
jgi:hypothetical protein